MSQNKPFTAISNPENLGQMAYDLASRLYPICRSITGAGIFQTLQIMQAYIPLTIHEVSSGTAVFDWTIPKEWNISDAYVKNNKGERVIDFQQSNLHVLNYSVPVQRTMPLSELRPHLYTLPDYPDWIPYRTSYYKENWGFCLSHNALSMLEEGEYEVCIDSSLAPGKLVYGEYVIPGSSSEEILFSTHVCHPSLCNDNLSGLGLCVALAKHLSGQQLRYTYRFLFVPGTIGSIAWLALNEAVLSSIRHGLVVACVGDGGQMHYKQSRRGKAEIDRAVEFVLRQFGQPYEMEEFSPYGYDERQYCSPGINLPVGSLTRTPHGRFPQYHTSADNLDFIKPEFLGDTIEKYLEVIRVLENNRKFINTNPKCEPQLGRRGLYSSFGGRRDVNSLEQALLWILNYSDGHNSMLDIAERSKLPFSVVCDAAQALYETGLLIEDKE
jgi:aminopeptidase-like protein